MMNEILRHCSLIAGTTCLEDFDWFGVILSSLPIKNLTIPLWATTKLSQWAIIEACSRGKPSEAVGTRCLLVLTPGTDALKLEAKLSALFCIVTVQYGIQNASLTVGTPKTVIQLQFLHFLLVFSCFLFELTGGIKTVNYCCVCRGYFWHLFIKSAFTLSTLQFRSQPPQHPPSCI